MKLPLSGSEPLFDSDVWAVVGNNCYDYAFGDNRPKSGLFSKKNNMVRNERGGWVRKNPRNQKSTPGGPNNNLTWTTCKGMHEGIMKDNPKNVYRCKNPNEVCRRGYYKVMAFVAPENDYGDSTGDFHFYKQVGAVRYKIKAGDTIEELARTFDVTPYTVRNAAKKLQQARNNTNGLMNNRSNGNASTIARNMAPNSNKNASLLIPGRIITFPINLWAHKLGWGTRPLLVDASGKTIKNPLTANRNYGYKYKTLCGVYCVRAGYAKTGNS
ncbi:hypothetical protein EBT31_03730 [bacterium]|nr:hypothetical protein [bacterium]NBX48819.1 hypothetical protein [bacterium]